MSMENDDFLNALRHSCAQRLVIEYNDLRFTFSKPRADRVNDDPRLPA